MAKRLQFLEKRSDPNKRQPPPRHHVIFEPVDAALLAVIALLMVWINWLLGILPG
jgi:hypothetical protein